MAHLSENKASVTGSSVTKTAPEMTKNMVHHKGPMMGMHEGMKHDMGPMMGMHEGMKHDMGPMMGMHKGMKHGMGPMMGMGEGMKHGMEHAMKSGMMQGAAASAGKSVLKKFLTHPATLIGLGVMVGYLAYKYRKNIIEATGKAPETS